MFPDCLKRGLSPTARILQMSPNVEMSDLALTRLNEVVRRSQRARSELLDVAVDLLHESYVGVPASKQLGIPFKKRYSDLEADVVLREIEPTVFLVGEAFRFERTSAEDIVVERGEQSDLASVPGFLTWLVPRYGRHTLPALLHDHLVIPNMDSDVREAADTTLRDAMGATKVPLVRRWIMWAAVSLATIMLRGWRWKVMAAAWVLFYAAAGFDLFLATIGRRPVPSLSSFAAIILIVVSPLILSLVWLRRYRFGLIVAYPLLILPGALLVVGVTLAVYVFAEGVAQLVLRAMRGAGQPVQINPLRVSKLR